VIEVKLTEEEYAFAVQKGNTDLLNKLNTFMTEIKANGKFDEIVNKYFGDGTPTAVTSAASMKTDGSQLIVATNAAFAPFEYKEGVNYYGIDMEIMAAFAEYLGKELYINDMNFDAVCLSVSAQGGTYEDENGATVAVTGGICDIAAAGLTVSETRMEILDFCTPYYDASQMLIVAENDTTFDECKTVEDVEKILKGFGTDVKVGVQTGTTGELYCKGDADWGFDGFGFTTTGYTNGALAVQDILNGGCKYVIIDEGPAKAIVEKMNAAN
jgi:polar amino acid transport system substrate-binding protein